jgi:signal transduction histidine kinase
MYNEIIQNEQTGNEVVNEFTSKSERELTRMEVLIQNLLKLTRLDAAAIELVIKNHNVKAFLQEVIKGFLTRAELEDKIILLDGSENVMMEFDDEWLLGAVGNIVKNALDHTNAKDKIEIRCDETPILTTITIKDNGTGIHSEDIHHIFKRFYRSRFSKDKQGVGIGLTLFKTIVEKHGGTIAVESNLGKGTTFRLAFPKISNL